MTHSWHQGDALRIGSQPLEFYGLSVEIKASNPVGTNLADLIIEDLQSEYGTGLERMKRLHKLAFRAALTCYLYQISVWSTESDTIPENLMDEAIDRACPDLWTDDPELSYYLQEIATLDAQRIENLIEALTNQLRHDHALTHKAA